LYKEEFADYNGIPEVRDFVMASSEVELKVHAPRHNLYKEGLQPFAEYLKFNYLCSNMIFYLINPLHSMHCVPHPVPNYYKIQFFGNPIKLFRTEVYDPIKISF